MKNGVTHLGKHCNNLCTLKGMSFKGATVARRDGPIKRRTTKVDKI